MQVQDSANYFQKAQEKYQSIKANQGILKTPTEIRRAFANLMLSLRQAEEVMVLPQHPNVQEIYKAEQRVSKLPVWMSSMESLCISIGVTGLQISKSRGRA